jgi:hypothetical protein
MHRGPRSVKPHTKQLASLMRRSDKQLYLMLAHEFARTAKTPKDHVTVRYHRSFFREKIGTRLKRSNVFSSFWIDEPMLAVFRAALGKKPSVTLGKTLFEELWAGFREKVCDEWNLCKKFKPSDPGFLLGLWAILKRGQPLGESDLYIIIAVLAVRLGPEWMCECSKREMNFP